MVLMMLIIFQTYLNEIYNKIKYYKLKIKMISNIDQKIK